MSAGPRHVERASDVITIPNHRALSLEIRPSHSLFIAGQAIHGILEILCETTKLRLGDISLELVGTEGTSMLLCPSIPCLLTDCLSKFAELTSLDHTASQTFHTAHVYFQSHHLPPSNAVDAEQASLAGYWVARPGKTRFQFSFPLPESAPSSAQFAGNAHLRYTLKASAQIQFKNERSTVMSKRDIRVVERLTDWEDERYWQPVRSEASDKVILGGNGSVWMEASIQPSIFWRDEDSQANNHFPLQITVKNNTQIHVCPMYRQTAQRLTHCWTVV